MIRVVRKRTLDDLREKAVRLEEFEEAQRKAREAIESMNRKDRRRAHRELWSGLPE